MRIDEAWSIFFKGEQHSTNEPQISLFDLPSLPLMRAPLCWRCLYTANCLPLSCKLTIIQYMNYNMSGCVTVDV